MKIEMIAFKVKLSGQLMSEGKHVTIACEVDSPLESVIWFRGNKRIYPGTKYELKNDKTHYSLTIKELIKSDEGEYSCALKRNPKVKTTATIKVDSSTWSIASIFLLYY